MKARRIILLLLVIFVTLGGVLILQVFLEQSQSFCGNSGSLAATISRSDLREIQFGGVQKYLLPPGRSPNAITVADDGSVWFGEQALPGVGHLYLNGTLVEYQWPFQYAPTSFTFIWGIAFWKGCVWASDQAGSQLIAVNPNTGLIETVKLGAESFPYTITIGPDDSLWFTEVFASKIGRIDDSFRLHEYPTAIAGTPAQIIFANDSLGYYVDTGNIGFVTPAIYSFNPTDFSPVRVGSDGGFVLRAPTSLALVPGGIWVTQHATSTLAYYDTNNHEWSLFPTSTVSYQDVTLPYFVAANGSLIWFNEHYANRLAKLDTTHELLTEYSLSNPPASRIIGIDNALTFTIANNRVWFTELTANNVGYVDASIQPNFTISPPTNNPVIKMKPGENTNLTFTIQGESTQPLTVQFADTENYTAKPQKIIITPNIQEITTLNGQTNLIVNIKTDKSLTPGNYTLLITITNGLISQSTYTQLQITTN
ncbi:MAG TPA: hypothetical protein VE862_12155 [Candidatus Acidoferrum sp.]|nr:hypothetical protein [Candidatus Acidoferrum sp.]